MEPFAPLPALAPPPPGVLPNFSNPQSRALMVEVSCVICLIFIVPISILRFYTNIWIKPSLKAEDWVCAVATVGSISYTAVVLSLINITGRHQWDVPLTNDLTGYAQKLILVVDMSYAVVAFTTKLSLFLLYHTLFSRHLWVKRLIYLGIALSFAMYTASFGAFGYLCLPHPGEGWLEAALSSRCHRQRILIGDVRGPFNLISDLYLLILPLPAVWQLHLPRKKKLGISGIFLTGLLACIASAFGLYFRFQVFNSPDLSWNLAPVLTTLVIEVNVGTICACLPHLPTFFRHHFSDYHRIAAVKTFASKINPFKSSKKTLDHRLGTHILGSARGEGKFLRSDDLSNATTLTTVTIMSEEPKGENNSKLQLR